MDRYYLLKRNSILNKPVNGVELPIGVLEVTSTGTNSLYQVTGSFGGSTILGGTVNFSSASFAAVLSNSVYDVHLQVVDIANSK